MKKEDSMLKTFIIAVLARFASFLLSMIVNFPIACALWGLYGQYELTTFFRIYALLGVIYCLTGK